MRAARKVAHILYLGENIPPPDRGRQPDDATLFARSALQAGIPRQLSALELLALAFIYGIEDVPMFTGNKSAEWAVATRRRWEVIRDRSRCGDKVPQSLTSARIV